MIISFLFGLLEYGDFWGDECFFVDKGVVDGFVLKLFWEGCFFFGGVEGIMFEFGILFFLILLLCVNV